MTAKSTKAVEASSLPRPPKDFPPCPLYWEAYQKPDPKDVKEWKIDEEAYAETTIDRVGGELLAVLKSSEEPPRLEAPNPSPVDGLPGRADTLRESPNWEQLLTTARAHPQLVPLSLPVLVRHLLPNGGGGGGGGCGEGGGGGEGEKEGEKKEEGEGEEKTEEAEQALAEAACEMLDAAAALDSILPGLADADIPLAKKRQLLEVLNNEELKRILELAGRISSQAWSPRVAPTDEGHEEPFDVTLGGELGRLLPTELMRLGHPLLKQGAYRDLVRRHLLQYQYKGWEPVQRGSIAVAMDVSFSMSAPHSGSLTRADIASAIAIGMVRIAAAQQRPVAVCAFGGDLVWQQALPAKAPISQAVALVEQILNSPWGGGTDFNPPFRWGLQQSTHHAADLILVTDGEGALSSGHKREVGERRNKEGMNFYYMHIGSERSDPSLSTLATMVVKTSDLMEMGARISASAASPVDKD